MVDYEKPYWKFKDLSPSEYELEFYIKNHKKLSAKAFQFLYDKSTGWINKGKAMNPKGNLEYVEQFEINAIYNRLLEVNLRGEINRTLKEIEDKYPIQIRSYKIIKGIVQRSENKEQWDVILKLGGVYGERI